MIDSANVKALLENTLNGISCQNVPFRTNALSSSVVLSSKNGSIISYAIDNSNPESSTSLSNLKMMSLLSKDKWNDDESQPSEQTTKSCYQYQWNAKGTGYKTRIYTYEIEELHSCLAQIPGSDLILLFVADSSFPYGLLVLKMKQALLAFHDMYGYKLG
ncbi:hypothetical protein KAFR_0C00320 [Kazachstania africana CBS 2517]|uniref:Roadblock/LAMTOR2 domain-containing protein n=1 Tax=Kazachstania africana (strain ATCC 22294 / BCRC 22015 / CBS 2517 / CECT 1963 / NBRC 1671 / NRRL Y-8276) TaxID=1071382 RepID=H2ARM8_KAZAF|nr:hypothetical protein KAFR_0C00320 [Kazachstania africana CBS 2517]CCF57028.1 hypothetical protein KAFR_0C00320 [Kazachstania africana CBS 2517]